MAQYKKGKQPILQSLKESELRYRRLFEAAQDGILILNAKTGAITDVNPFLVKMLGYTRDEFIEKKLWEVGAFNDVKASKEAFQLLQTNEYIRYKDLPLRTRNGKLIQVEFVSNVYIRDITERKQTQDAILENQARLRELTIRDHLTSLFNRRYMEETLERELHRALRKQYPLGIIMLDVDYLRRFNNAYGHAAGDVILREIGTLLLKHVRLEDIASRIGGDEFVVILPDSPIEITQTRADLLRENVHRFQIQFEGRALKRSLSPQVWQSIPNMVPPAQQF